MENLKKLRLNRGLTQEKLCKELRKHDLYIDRTTYSKYETGSRNIPCDVLVKFAVFFETTYDYILGLKE